MSTELNESMIELARAGTIAKMLAVEERTVRDWVCKGIIPYVKLGEGKKSALRFHVPTIRKWAATRAVNPVNTRV